MGLKSLEIRLKLLKIARQEICLSCGVARARMRYAAVASPRLTPLLSKPTAEPSEHLTHLDGVLTRRLLRHPLRNPFRSRRPRQEWDVLLEGVSHTAARVPTPRQFIRRSGKLSVQKRSKSRCAPASVVPTLYGFTSYMAHVLLMPWVSTVDTRLTNAYRNNPAP